MGSTNFAFLRGYDHLLTVILWDVVVYEKIKIKPDTFPGFARKAFTKRYENAEFMSTINSLIIL